MNWERLLKILLGAAAVVVVFACASCFKSNEISTLKQESQIRHALSHALSGNDRDIRFKTGITLTKQDVCRIIDSSVILTAQQPEITVEYLDQPLTIETSLDTSLQEAIRKRISKSSARQVAVVVMEPDTGRIISMAGFDRDADRANPCTSRCFPAASIFKMITAAAAIESRDFSPATTLHFNGRKHTLYKSQLKDIRNRWTVKISLRDSFAQSVNPVFGKIGIYSLGKDLLEKYAYAFGFDRRLDFELPVEESRFSITDDSYRIAEIASGFNRETRITPLHGALIIAAAVNSGTIMTPAVVDTVEDIDGRILYRNHPHPLSQAISADSAKRLRALLEATVRRGTARKAFRGWKRDRVLSSLDIGGKTGTIDNREHTVRYDWFCGFAQDKKSGKKIAIAVLVGHAKPKLDVRAATYARYTIRDYFAKEQKAIQVADAKM